MKDRSSRWLRGLFLTIILTTIAMAGLSPTGGSVTALAADKDIVVSYTNDVHCGVDDDTGYAGLALYKKGMQQQTSCVALVDTGNVIQGAPIGTLSDGGCLIDIVNYVEYDFAVPGNHEFDYGMSRLLVLVGKLNYGYYSCNSIDSATGTPVLASYKMLTYGATQVTFVGATMSGSLIKSVPVYFQDSQDNYIYSSREDENGQELYDQVQASVDAARTTGADHVILVGHLGENGITQKQSSTSVITNTTGIDVCTDGRSHEATPPEDVKSRNGQNVVLTQMRTKLNHIGKLTISADGSIRAELVSEVSATGLDREYTVQGHDFLGGIAKKELGSYSCWINIRNSNLDKVENADVIPVGSNTMIPGKGYINSDGGVVDYGTYQFTQFIENQYNETLETVLGATPYELIVNDPTTKNRIVRNAGTDLGNLTADAYRAGLSANIGLSNGDEVRSIIKPRNITYNDTPAVFPCGNMGCVIEATGRQIEDVLEMAFKNCPEKSGSFLRVSGLTYTIDASVKSGVQTDDKGSFTGVSGTYRVMNIKMEGEPIDLKKTHTVASHDYMPKQGGDSIAMFRGRNIIRDETMMNMDILSSYT